MKNFVDYDRISELETALIGIDGELVGLRTQYDAIETDVYLAVESAYDEAKKNGDQKEMNRLSNEKKRKIVVSKILSDMKDVTTIETEIDSHEMEKRYMLVELGAEKRAFVRKYGKVGLDAITGLVG